MEIISIDSASAIDNRWPGCMRTDHWNRVDSFKRDLIEGLSKLGNQLEHRRMDCAVHSY